MREALGSKWTGTEIETPAGIVNYGNLTTSEYTEE